MREILLECLICPRCGKQEWKIQVDSKSEYEIREGILSCLSCGRQNTITKGIVDCLGELSLEVAHEKNHAESLGYLVTPEGESCVINEETIQCFRNLFLSLPAGDGSAYFKPGGSFDNQAGNAERFFKTLDLLNLTGEEKILEVGASFGWGAWRFAQRGCQVVALDVTNYLQAADLYFDKDGCYFDRVMADMNALPFSDGSFDIIFSHSVIHHCKNIENLFCEFYRVLRPGGRVVALHECAFGIFEDKSGKALKKAIDEGFNENAYTLWEWWQGARRGGFLNIRFHFFSLVDDYIHRKKIRGSGMTGKLRFAYWIKARPFLNRLINLLSIIPRIILRPKAWMMMASRSK
ncbi:MAG: class I SAM-dependent methyltransferase [Candidatus Omnitrophica bacterium]|nr:class I SAM-dependent methyltransferase [Candidatus Omnitrophota bacterium]